MQNPFLEILGKGRGEDTEKLKKEILDRMEALEKSCHEKLEMLDVKLFAANKTFVSKLDGIEAQVREIGPDIFAKIAVMETTFKEMKRDNEKFKAHTTIDVAELQRQLDFEKQDTVKNRREFKIFVKREVDAIKELVEKQKYEF